MRHRRRYILEVPYRLCTLAHRRSVAAYLMVDVLFHRRAVFALGLSGRLRKVGQCSTVFVQEQ